MKYFKGFKQLFSQAGEYCNQCYLASEPNEEERRGNVQALANSLLTEIIKSSEREEIQKIVKGAVKICRSCEYRDPNIFNYLESNGLTFR